MDTRPKRTRAARLLPALAVALAVLSTWSATAVARPGDGAPGPAPVRPRAAPCNPDFLHLLVAPGLAGVLSGVGRPLGAVPTPTSPFRAGAAPGAGRSYAASFDLRTAGKVSPVKDQNPWGTCWTFATVGSMESCLLTGETAYFAEDNMALASGFDINGALTPDQLYNAGGNYQMSTAYLARWSGPLWQSEDAYGDRSTPTGVPARKHVQNVDWYPARTSATDNDTIKYALTTFGAVYASMSFQGSSNGSAYYNATTHAYYYNGSQTLNHAVLIVGWDDNYAAANFATTPPGNGAFIVKNSWGTGWGESGFFYLSYYDSVFARTDRCATFHGIEAVTDYTSSYQYDPLGAVSSIGIGGTTLWGANRFVASSSDPLAAVGLYAEAPNTAFEIWEGPSMGALTMLTQGTLPMGYHTVPLPSPVALSSGTGFVVAVRFTTPGYTFPLPVEYAVPNYSDFATALAGQSYFKTDGGTWTDLTDPVNGFNATANVCIKAFTAPPDTTPPVTTDDHLSVPAIAPMTITLTAVDSGSGMVGGLAKTEYKVDGAAAYTVGTSVVLGEGAHTVAYRSTDAAGNLETPDKTFAVTVAPPPPPPQSSSSYAFAADASSDWHQTAQPVAMTATGGAGTGRTIHYSSDGGANWTATVADAATAVVSGDGAHHFLFFASDSLATEETHDAGYVNIDATPPVTGDDHLVVPPVSPATYTLSPADATSGMSGGAAKTEYRIDGAAAYTTGTSFTLHGGTHTVSFRSTDAAGNVETPDRTFTVTVSGPAAPVSGSTYAFSADAESGWHRAAQAVAIAVTGGSGIGTTVHYSTDGGATWTTAIGGSATVTVAGDGAHHFLFFASDSLATEETHDAGWVNVDTARPSTRARAASVKTGRTVLLRYRVSDAPSGCCRAVARLEILKGRRVVKTARLGEVPANVTLTCAFRARLPKGRYSFRIRATDQAGNVATRIVAARLLIT